MEFDRKKVDNAINHLKTITEHKKTVMDLCFKVGLVKQGLLHDLSKYNPVEFMTGINYYQGGKRSPNAAEKKQNGYSVAWNHHKGRNKHHFEYWLDVSYQGGQPIAGAKMPLKYVIEMACDRIAACKVYHGAAYKDSDPWEYYMQKIDRVAPALHPETKELLEKILIVLRDRGEDKALTYMRWLLKHPEVYEKSDEGRSQHPDQKLECKQPDHCSRS